MATKDLNKAMFTGRLGADPEMRYTPSGSAVVNFRIASGRSWKNDQGETVENTEWISIVAWNKLAEICNEWLVKGSRVYVEGRLQTRDWEDDKGVTRYKTEVIISDMIMLDSKGSKSEATPQQSSKPAPRNVPQSNVEDLPF